jgi:hypothetical protein
MQSAANVAHSVYRIVFRGGSPQRVQYSDGRLIGVLCTFVGLTIASQLLYFRASTVEVGLSLFTLLTGTYIGFALLTRKVSRQRLRQVLLTVFLILACAQALLLLATPIARLDHRVSITFAVIVAFAALMGVANSVQFGLASSRVLAWQYTLGFACALAAFYGTMHFLLRTVFG